MTVIGKLVMYEICTRSNMLCMKINAMATMKPIPRASPAFAKALGIERTPMPTFILIRLIQAAKLLKLWTGEN